MYLIAKKTSFLKVLSGVLIAVSVSIAINAENFDISRFKDCSSSKKTFKRSILANTDFERAPSGWSMPVGFSVDPRGGRSLTKCIKLTRVNPKSYTLNGHGVKLIPGKLYAFGVWIKTENVKGKDSGASICMEFSRIKNGKKAWAGGAYPTGIKGTTDWTLIKGVVRVPKKAISGAITLYLRKKMTGTAWFDDIYLYPASITAWSVYLTKPAINTISNKNGKIELAFSCGGKSIMKKAPENALFCQIRIKKLNKTFTAPIKKNRAKFDFGKLAVGNYKLKIYCLDTKKKKILNTNTISIKVASADREVPTNACVFDSKGRAIVNGKKFLPIGIYTGNPPKYYLNNMKRAGFNCVMPYGSMLLRFNRKSKTSLKNITEVLDYCEKKKLKVIFSLKDVCIGVKAPVIDWLGMKTEEKIVEKAVSNFKNHPALLAWYINDEQPINNLPKLIKRRNLVNKLDPFHPTWAVMYQFADLGMYGPSCDIIGVDPYPIHKKSSDNMKSVNAAMKQANFTGLPNWVVPQLFDAGFYQPKKFQANYRGPTESELRSMIIAMTSQGAKGFIFYSYETQRYKGKFKEAWLRVGRIVKFLRELEPFIMSDYKIEKLKLQKIKGKVIAVKMTDDNGRKIILISGQGPGKSKAVINIANSAKYKSQHNNTIVKDGKLIFSGKDICSDILYQQ
jgi:hypothetical protein